MPTLKSTAAAGASFDPDGTKWRQWTNQELFSVPEIRGDAGFEKYRVDGAQSFLIEGLPAPDGQKTFAYGYWTKPSGEPPDGGWPAVVLYHGGGGTAFAEYAKAWSRRGYVAITVDHYGQLPDTSVRRPDRPVLPCSWAGMAPKPFLPEDSENGDPEMRRLWIRNAVALLAHCHTYLLQLPYVDPRKTGLLGISWGSVMGSILASLDRRFAFAVFCYGCGYFGEGEDMRSFRKFAGSPWEPANFIPDLQTPCYWIIGTNDMAFELPCWQKSVDNAPGTQGMSIVSGIDHAHTGWLYDMTCRFADSRTGRATAPPRLGKNVLDGNVVTAEIVAPGEGIKHAELCYTLEPDSRLTNQWHTAPATIDGAYICATLPEGTRAFFLNACDRMEPRAWKWSDEAKKHLPAYDASYSGNGLWPASSPYTQLK